MLGSARTVSGVALLLGSAVSVPASAQDAGKPVVTVVAAEAHLTLRSDPPGVALYRQVPSGGPEPTWEVICTAPCTFVMREGNYPLALSWGGNTRPVGLVAIPSGGGTLYARWKEQKISPLRVVLGVAALAGGTYLVLSAKRDEEECTDTCRTTSKTDPLFLWSGVGLLALGAGLTISAFFNAPKATVQLADAPVERRAFTQRAPGGGGVVLGGSF